MTRLIYSRAHELLRIALVDARSVAELTQSELAKKLRRPQSYVSKYENGERRLDVLEFLEVVRALKTSPYRIIRKVFSAL